MFKQELSWFNQDWGRLMGTQQSNRLDNAFTVKELKTGFCLAVLDKVESVYHLTFTVSPRG